MWLCPNKDGAFFETSYTCLLPHRAYVCKVSAKSAKAATPHNQPTHPTHPDRPTKISQSIFDLPDFDATRLCCATDIQYPMYEVCGRHYAYSRCRRSDKMGGITPTHHHQPSFAVPLYHTAVHIHMKIFWEPNDSVRTQCSMSLASHTSPQEQSSTTQVIGAMARRIKTTPSKIQ